MRYTATPHGDIMKKFIKNCPKTKECPIYGECPGVVTNKQFKRLVYMIKAVGEINYNPTGFTCYFAGVDVGLVWKLAEYGNQRGWVV